MRGSAFFSEKPQGKEDCYLLLTMGYGDAAEKYKSICKKIREKFPELLSDAVIAFYDSEKEIRIYLPMPLAHWLINTGLGLHVHTNDSDAFFRGMENLSVNLELRPEHTREFTDHYLKKQEESTAHLRQFENYFHELEATCTPDDLLAACFSRANNLIIGENHLDTSAREFLVDNIKTLVEKYRIECFYHETFTKDYQVALDQYFDPSYTGDVPDKLLNYLSYVEQALYGAAHHRPKEWQGSHIQLLRALKAAGIKHVIAIDSPRYFFDSHHWSSREMLLRCLYVNQNAFELYQNNQKATQRSIFFVGSNHAVRLSLKDKSFSPQICYGLGELLTAPTIHISSKPPSLAENAELSTDALDAYVVYQNHAIQSVSAKKPEQAFSLFRP